MMLEFFSIYNKTIVDYMTHIGLYEKFFWWGKDSKTKSGVLKHFKLNSLVPKVHKVRIRNIVALIDF